MSLKEWVNSLRDDREKEDEVRKAYNLLFTSTHGQKVLAHMLTELHFFDEITTDEEKHLSNYARRLLFRIGVLQGANIPDITSAILRIPFNRREDDEDR